MADLPVLTFATKDDFAAWLDSHHASSDGLVIKMAKKGSGVPSVALPEALDVALCYGWIDGKRKSHDETYFLQQYTPRRARSRWSKINVAKVEALIASGEMRPAGLAEIERAKADGRWDAAYAPIRATTVSTLPRDLRAAIEANPRAKRTFRRLNKQNLFALAFRTNAMKTPAGRARKITALVTMLARGETIAPNRPERHSRK
jgi:uncharacterized protein YdeI (YjbR/CyaY-like superfamily)